MRRESAGFRVFALFMLLALVAYANIIDAFFLSDDFALIGRVLEGDLSFVWGSSSSGVGGFFRPVFILSYAVDSKLWGRAPAGFHLTNLLLHASNAFLVSRISLRLTRDGRFAVARPEAVALLGGLIFLLHPSHTEAVSWISGRVDLLAAFFFLTSLLLYLSHVQTKSTAKLAFSLVCFALALLAKESAACLPFVVIMTGAAAAVRADDGRRAVRQSLKTAALFFAVLMAYVVVRTIVLGALVGGYGESRHLNFSHSVVVSQLLRFFLRSISPAIALSGVPFLESRALSPVLIVVGAIVVGAAAVVFARGRARRALLARARRHRFLWVMWALFLCCLLPVINLRINIFDTQGERYLYLPSVFSSLALSYLASGVVRNAKLSAVIISCLLGFYAATLWLTNQNWREAARLSRHLLEDVVTLSTRDGVVLLNAPDNYRGAYLFRNGIEQALRTFQHTKAIRRAHIVAFHGLQHPRAEVRILPEAGALSLELSDRETAFERIDGAPEGCVKIIDHSRSSLRLRADGCAATDDVFYFTAGRIHKVPDPP